MKTRVKCIHFTGIGGIGMSGIAEVLHNQGYTVQGSDAAESPNIERLRTLGMRVFVGHASGQLGEAQVVVVSSAIAADNVELAEALARGIPVIPRAEMLAELMRMKQGVAVAGSHGKTTITSMIAHAMEVAGLDPTYVIGGRLIASGDNARLGESPYLVAEADESDGSFLLLSPVIAVVSNIDPEHLDHYGDFDHLLAAFRQFISSVPFYGRAVLHHEHPNVALLRDDLHKPILTYGRSPQADFHLIEDIPQAGGQRVTFGYVGGAAPVSFNLPMPGPHNAENALAAVAVLSDLGVDMPTICRGMESFSGIQRRFQIATLGGGTLVDDYAHHPSEVMATLTTVRQCWPDASPLVFFQPHRYTRSRDLMSEFLGAFDDAAEVLLLPVYAAGEKAIKGVSSEQMAANMQQRGHRHVACCADMGEAREAATEALADGRIVLMMGAGSIGGLAEALRRDLQERPR